MTNSKPSVKNRAVTYLIFFGTFLLAVFGPSLVSKYLGPSSRTSNFDQLAGVVRYAMIVTSPILLGWLAYRAIKRRRGLRR